MHWDVCHTMSLALYCSTARTVQLKSPCEDFLRGYAHHEVPEGTNHTRKAPGV